MRILHIPVDLGGHPTALARQQRAMGHDVIVGNLAWSPFGFVGDRDYSRPNGSLDRLPRREFGRLTLFLRSVLWADVIHAHFGQTLASLRPFPIAYADEKSGVFARLSRAASQALWLRDVDLWRRLGKTVAMTFYGDDVRQVDEAPKSNPWSHLANETVAAQLSARDPFKRQMVQRLSASGVRMFAVNPDLMRYLPDDAQFLPYGHVSLDAVRVVAPRLEGPLRLLHLPSYRAAKGTEHFVAAVDRLRQAGHDCTLTVVEGVNNATAQNLIADHDILLDQLHAGWYGGVALEAMAAGKPVIAHIAHNDLGALSPDMARELPVVAASPETILPVLTELVSRPRPDLANLGLSARKYAERWHAPEAVARAVTETYL